MPGTASATPDLAYAGTSNRACESNRMAVLQFDRRVLPGRTLHADRVLRAWRNVSRRAQRRLPILSRVGREYPMLATDRRARQYQSIRGFVLRLLPLTGRRRAKPSTNHCATKMPFRPQRAL